MARRIFRESALRRYNERLEKVELPRYATLPWATIWLVCGLSLMLFAGLLWAADMPVYATGSGFVAEQDAPPGEVVVVALLPSETAAQVVNGQAARVDLPDIAGGIREVEGRVTSIEPESLSPAGARARFHLLDHTPGGPVTVVYVALDAAALGATGETNRALWLGSRADVRVAIGTQSGLALLPGVGEILAEGG